MSNQANQSLPVLTEIWEEHALFFGNQEHALFLGNREHVGLGLSVIILLPHGKSFLNGTQTEGRFER